MGDKNMYCTKCGTQLNDGANFCTKCGERTDNALDRKLKEQQLANEQVKSGCWGFLGIIIMASGLTLLLGPIVGVIVLVIGIILVGIAMNTK